MQKSYVETSNNCYEVLLIENTSQDCNDTEAKIYDIKGCNQLRIGVKNETYF